MKEPPIKLNLKLSFIGGSIYVVRASFYINKDSPQYKLSQNFTPSSNALTRREAAYRMEGL
jgi:hypothetical protein